MFLIFSLERRFWEIINQPDLLFSILIECPTLHFDTHSFVATNRYWRIKRFLMGFHAISDIKNSVPVTYFAIDIRKLIDSINLLLSDAYFIAKAVRTPCLLLKTAEHHVYCWRQPNTMFIADDSRTPCLLLKTAEHHVYCWRQPDTMFIAEDSRTPCINVIGADKFFNVSWILRMDVKQWMHIYCVVGNSTKGQSSGI